MEKRRRWGGGKDGKGGIENKIVAAAVGADTDCIPYIQCLFCMWFPGKMLTTVFSNCVFVNKKSLAIWVWIWTPFFVSDLHLSQHIF